jgi:hypothetical protein
VESDTDEEDTDPRTNPPAVVAVERAVESSISTLGAEISELDKIDFDETIPVDEYDDI